MKISLKWIHDFVDVSDYFSKPEALADILTGAGLEVEEIHNRAKDFGYVVTGIIIEKDKHPDAEKLSLCRVSTGEGVVHQIVCGAKNHKADDRVVVALPGAVLPGNFAIKQAVVRGVESAGMLCSLKELGLVDDSDGIYILPSDAPIGKAFAEYAGLDDVTFELKVTANRADCLSHYGLAREISCLLNRPLKPMELALKTSSESTKSLVQLAVQKTDLCPRYAGRVIRHVKVGDSPQWLKSRLESVGLNSINNVVDVTNYVMLEMGQPLHAFDLKEILDGKIIVDQAQPGEKFVTLDGTELSLTGEELMIRDARRPLAMAGVVGGKNSGVSLETRDLFIESAYFSPQTVRKTSRRHGVNTDSSYRFARGVDPSNTLNAMNRCCQLILQVAGGDAWGDHHDVISQDFSRESIRVTAASISERLGYSIDIPRFEEFMLRLGCKLSKTGDEYLIEPPLFRFDIEQDVDLIEEYARLYGYEHIPESLPVMGAAPETHDAQYILSQKLIDQMTASGFSQAINFAFASEKEQQSLLGPLEGLKSWGLFTGEVVRILNPLAEDMNVMRSSLLPSLYKNLQHNYHHANTVGRLFELGHVFCKQGEVYSQFSRLGAVAWGRESSLWSKGVDHPVLFDIKAAIEELLAYFKIGSYQFVKGSEIEASLPFLHPGQSAAIKIEGKILGYMGSLHPLLLDETKLRCDVAVMELDLDSLLKGQPRSYRVQAISKFPAVERDFAFLMPKKMAVAGVEQLIQKTVGAQLQSVAVVDIFEGEPLGLGQKSVTFRLKLQDMHSTLTEAQVNEAQQKVLNAVKSQFSIGLR